MMPGLILVPSRESDFNLKLKTEINSTDTRQPTKNLLSALFCCQMLGAFVAIADDSSLVSLPLGVDKTAYYVPHDNPMTRSKVELGRLLFFDRRLSINNTVSCSSCHLPSRGFSNNTKAAIGIKEKQGNRNTPTIINRIANATQFWDGRAGSLEEQAIGPLTNPIEMGMPSLDAVVDKVSAIKGYRKLFNEAFGSNVSIEGLAKAIASFERTIISGNSRWDQFEAGNSSALSDAEKRGLEIFEGKGRCNQCHSGWNLTDEKIHNLGIGWDQKEVDLGRFQVTGLDEDKGAFKTPTLRDISETGPYMHDGRFASLEKVVEYYNDGAIDNPYLDPEMQRPDMTLEETLARYSKKNSTDAPPVKMLNLTYKEREDLVAFMLALSGEGWQNIQAPEAFPE